MNGNELGTLLLCTICLVPFLTGIGVTLAVQRRASKLGFPWAILPLGGLLKNLWEHYR